MVEYNDLSKEEQAEFLDALELIKITFDSSENRDPTREESLGIFVEGDGLTAFGKLAHFVSTLPSTKIYIGYDELFYPQYKIKKVKIC